MNKKDIGNGDSDNLDQNKEMSKTLNRLKQNKQILSQKLSEIVVKTNELRDKLKLRKDQKLALEYANRALKEQLSRLMDESSTLNKSVAKLDTNIVESRESVQQLTTYLFEKREQQSLTINDISAQMNDLSQSFVHLSTNSISETNNESKGGLKQQIESQLTKLSQQIETAKAKRESLIKQLNELKANSEPLFHNSGRLSNEPEFQYKWNDWPIRERIIAIEIFSEENQSFVEDIELLQKTFV